MGKEKGQSLISLIVLMSLLLVVIVGATNAVLTGYMLKKRINDNAEAHRIIRDQLENLKTWASVKGNFDSLVENDKWAAIPARPAIPNVISAIPAESASQRVYTNFAGNVLVNGKPKYAEQFLVKNFPLSDSKGNIKIAAKNVTIRIYYANSQGNYIDTTKHKEPSGSGIKRFENPLAELSDIIQNPSVGAD
ncbi:MAG TPA: hypothetical protein PL130_06765 [Dictyoglomaceae bacterium]|nr:hypothetical protein [Dictyoglomaceae bacterium]